MDKYNLIYDHRNEMINPYWIILAVLAVVLLYYLVIKKSSFFSQKLYAFLIVACIGSPFGLYIFIRILMDNNSIRTMMNESKYSIVEGEIVSYEMSGGKGLAEKFALNDALFHYSRYEVISGFHNTNPEKEIIKGNGQYVRIGYYTKMTDNYTSRNYIVLIEE